MRASMDRPIGWRPVAGIVASVCLGGLLIAAVADPGLVGKSTASNGTGVLGTASGSNSAGVEGQSDDGAGVYGTGRVGVQGFTSGETAVVGEFREGKAQGRFTFIGDDSKRRNWGSLGSAGSGVEGYANLDGAFAIKGDFEKGTVVMLGGKDSAAVMSHGKETSVMLADKVNAVVGKSTVAGGKGIAGSAEGKDGVGVYGQNTEGLAGFFRGKVTVEGILMAQQIFAPKGLVGSGAKFFKIDHPLEPAEKYLWHASIESDARKNMYDGVAVLDTQGTGWVLLPAWFQALNKDFRYQLTCIGGYAQVFIAQEIKDNRFQIAGGKPGLKVSWQVTGVRQDAYANANPMRVEEPKSAADRGRYLNPVELGFPESLRIGTIAVANLRP